MQLVKQAPKDTKTSIKLLNIILGFLFLSQQYCSQSVDILHQYLLAHNGKIHSIFVC